MKKTGLFFGSFNPIHLGHLIMAHAFLVQADMAEVWFVVSPQNPLKPSGALVPDTDRLAMVKLAINGNKRFQACDVEFSMARPSYTSDTLRKLISLFPDRSFALLMGDDLPESLLNWKDYSYILNTFPIHIYPRNFDSPVIPAELASFSFHSLKAPRMEISSTLIRDMIRKNISAHYLIPESVRTYIEEHKLYR